MYPFLRHCCMKKCGLKQKNGYIIQRETPQVITGLGRFLDHCPLSSSKLTDSQSIRSSTGTRSTFASLLSL